MGKGESTTTNRGQRSIPPGLLALLCGLLGWLSALLLDLSLLGHILLALGAAAFGLSRLLQPLVAKRWRRAANTLAALREYQHDPGLRAWVVWLLLALLFIDLALVFGWPDWRGASVPVGQLLVALFFGYLVWQTRGGRKVKWALGPAAGWTAALFTLALPPSPDNGVLLGKVNTQLAGIDAKINRLLEGQELINNTLSDITAQLAQLNAERDAADAAGIRRFEEGETPPHRPPLTDAQRDEYVRLKTMAAALANAGNQEAMLALYQAALRTGDDERIEQLKPQVDRLLSAERARELDIRNAEGLRLFYARRYADAAEAFLTAMDLRADDETVRKRFGLAVVSAVIHGDESSPRHDQLIDQLDALAAEFPDDGNLRKSLAMALKGAVRNSEADFTRANRLLDKLRKLFRDHPDDEGVRRELAMALTNAISNSKPGSDSVAMFLPELKALAMNPAYHSFYREAFASAIKKMIERSGDDFDRADKSLAEHRELLEAFPKSSSVRERFADSLVLAINNSGFDPQRTNILLDELRSLVDANLNEIGLRERLVQGLFSAIVDGDANLNHADGWLAALQELSGNHPDDVRLLEDLVWACGAYLFNANKANDVGRAAKAAEALVPLAETLHRDARLAAQIREDLTAAIAMAIEKSDTESEQRLRATRTKVFGEHSGGG